MARRAPAHPELRTIGTRLKAVRESGGWTQEQLAEAIGVTPHTISQYERGEQSPRLTTLLRIASAFSVPPGALVDIALPSPQGAPPPEGAEVLTLYLALPEEDRRLAVRLLRDIVASRRER
jgi:transcriptional regulator with XRE-family HTH domain